MTTVSMPRRLPRQKLFRCPACSKMPEAACDVELDGVWRRVVLCSGCAVLLIQTCMRGVEPKGRA